MVLTSINTKEAFTLVVLLDNLISWFREVLDQLEISQLSAAAGYSMGSYLTIVLATKAPDLFKSKAILLLCAPPMAFSNMKVSSAFKISLTIMYGMKPMAIEAYKEETQAGIAEESKITQNAFELLKSVDKFAVYKGMLPDLSISRFSVDELKSLAENFRPTFLCP